MVFPDNVLVLYNKAQHYNPLLTGRLKRFHTDYCMSVDDINISTDVFIVKDIDKTPSSHSEALIDLIYEKSSPNASFLNLYTAC
ncbi:hypothetical protein N483_10065 [Pseudoalteromonas luteoviolacea NCIMB 1944]|nr:hypothetical protein N483_10065 [Pseudoalteromonas luteoviolacea NCIMB 1944]